MPEKIGRALASRPVFERDITRTISPEGIANAPGATQIQTPNLGPSGEILPGTNQQELQLGSGGFVQPPPSEQQTETLRVQGAPRGLTFLADFLTGFGGGPQAATQQQALRRLGVNQQLDLVQQQADRQAAFQQRQFQNKLGLRRVAATETSAKASLLRAKRERVPSSFGQLAVQAFIDGNPSRAADILAFSRKEPNAVRERSGRDLVLFDPSTLKEITRKKNFFPASNAEKRLGQNNELGQIASALLLKTLGNVENARKEALALAQQDPSGFAAKNLDKLLKAINSTSLRSSKTLAEILLQLAQESNQ